MFISLGQGCWLDELALGLALHEGAVFASFSSGEPDEVIRYADELMKYTSLDDSLDIQPCVLKSLSQSGRHEQSIQRGIDILHQLQFDFPSTPTMENIVTALTSTAQIASQYSVEQMINLCDSVVDDSVHQVVKIMDAFYASCYASSSPFLAIIIW